MQNTHYFRRKYLGNVHCFVDVIVHSLLALAYEATSSRLNIPEMYTMFHKIGTPLYFCNNFFKC